MLSRQTTSASLSARQIVEMLSQSLETALPEQCSEKHRAKLTLQCGDGSTSEPSVRRVLVKFRSLAEMLVRLSVEDIGDTAYELHVDVEDGPSRRFTYSLSDEAAAPGDTTQLGRTVAAFLLFEMEQRTDETLLHRDSSMEKAPHIPLLSLDQDGTIENVTEAARRVLEYSSEASIEPCFFSHVHGRNLRRVMWDLARMVCYYKQRAQWLLRLRTGNGRWRWYRATVQNHLHLLDGSIQVCLRPL